MSDSPIPMLDLVRLHAPLRDELSACFQALLESGRFIGGQAVDGFEGELAAHVGADHAIGVSSGTDALLVTLMALGVGPEDEVITSPYTFFATAGAIARLGARPVFVDIDPKTFNLDPATVQAAISERTVGLLPVHLFGLCAEMDPILTLAEEHGLWVLEDAAQAIGAEYHGRKAGTMGNAGIYSFFPAKNLGAVGDAGAVVTNDPDLAARIRSLRQHGAARKYYHDDVGGNFRIDALQAAVLSAKLPHLRGWEQGRIRSAGHYDNLLSDLEGVQVPTSTPHCRHVFSQYVIRCQRRDAVEGALRSAGIGCAIYYPVPLHRQECFAHLGHHEGDFEASEQAAIDTLAIPIDPNIQPEQQSRIADLIKEQLK